MGNSCENIQEQIPELITSTLPAEKAAELQRHISHCPACSEYLEALQADDKLLSEFAEAMQPRVARLENKVIEVLNHVTSKEAVSFISIWRRVLKSRMTRLAAAAVLLISLGYVGGWFSARWLLGMEQLQSALETSMRPSLETDIRRSLLAEINRDRQLALASYHTNLKEQFNELRSALNKQQRRDLNEFAVKTLAASNAVTNQLLRELIESIATVQTRDRRWVAAALNQIKSNRLQDKTRFRSGLATLAVQTAKEMRQTKHDVAKFLIQTQPDRLMQNVPETLNEGSENENY